MRVLLVEAEEPLALLLRHCLEAEGYEVECVTHADEAEARLRHQLFDLVVLNSTLPDLSGVELCRRIREPSVADHLPIIMVSADARDGDRVEGFAAGADDYVVLPLSMPDFLARVQSRLPLRRVRHAPQPLIGTNFMNVGPDTQ